MTANTLQNKKKLRLKRKLRVRAHCIGSATKPRVSVFKSNKYFYAQAIDDDKSHTLVSIDGRKEQLSNNKDSVSKLGVLFATKLKEAGIKEVVFDRNGYLYHGVVAAFADSLRDNGIAL